MSSEAGMGRGGGETTREVVEPGGKINRRQHSTSTVNYAKKYKLWGDVQVPVSSPPRRPWSCLGLIMAHVTCFAVTLYEGRFTLR